MKVPQLRSVVAALLIASAMYGQSGSATISGVVNDAQGAVIPNAKITLTNQAQGAVVRELTTGGEGTFVITPVQPGVYSLTVELSGFRQEKLSNINVSINDRIGLPAIKLEVGAVGESVTVEATTIQLETVSAERSGVVTGKQMVDIALNGRNYTGLLRTIPGASLEGTFGGNPSFNGQRSGQNNFAVDGQTVTDSGVNTQGGFGYRINVDAIQEMKVSTNGQSAEFGRTSGAQVQVVTKGGTSQYHGTGWFFKRGEFMNANDFIRNQANLQRSIYRFMQTGYNFGGPIPAGSFNKDKNKLFFFMSHEWGRSLTPPAARQITVPTAAERGGDFSASHDATGFTGNSIQIIKDPLTGQPFPGNIVPVSRFNQYGPELLNWLPLPNVSGQPLYNYQSQVPAAAPTFDQVYRGDYNINDKWRLFVRGLSSKSTANNPYGRADSGNALALSPLLAATFGKTLAGTLTTVINPTLTNEFQLGYTVNGIPGLAPEASSIYYRKNAKVNTPLLFSGVDSLGLVPNINVGGIPGPNFSANAASGLSQLYTNFAGLPYSNRNPIWNITNNVNKIKGNHTIKAGIFIEAAVKTENPFRGLNPTIDFSRDANNPGDTNWAFANALLGNFKSYTQINRSLLSSYPYKNFEWYAQDSYKLTKKLTLNYGLRMALINPLYDTNNLMANFNNSTFDSSKRVILFQPGLNGNTRVAVNPLTGATAPVAQIGLVVPGSGDLNNGMVVSGQGGTPRGLIDNRGIHWAPRFGAAYSLNSKTVLRMGGGVFYERIATFSIGYTSNYVTNPPTMRESQIPYGNLSNIGSGNALNAPASVTRLSQDGHVPTTYNYSFGLQRQLPKSLYLDVSYVGSQSRHLTLGEPFNQAPLGSAWLPQNQDAALGRPVTTDGSTALVGNFIRPYVGYGVGTNYTFGTSTNYNSLQTAINKRAGRGLNFGLTHTWAKSMGVDVGHQTNTRRYGYGPLNLDRTQTFTFNFIYDVPSLAKAISSFNSSAPAKYIFDGWQLSGLTSMGSGAPVNVTYSVAGVGAQVLNRTITGSEDVAPRVSFTCEGNLNYKDKNINRYINTDCFAMTPKGSQGLDSSFNHFRGPGINQTDLSLFKKINFTESKYIQLRLEAYNAFNHTQWGTLNAAAVFNSATGKITNLPNQLGGTGGRFGFGALSNTRANSQRILQIGAKIYF
jgi:Carboxypeptidase regulatory-like domain